MEQPFCNDEDKSHMLRMVEEEARRQSRFLNDVVEQLDQLALSTSRLVVTSEKKKDTPLPWLRVKCLLQLLLV